jgi:hypothetical protein
MCASMKLFITVHSITPPEGGVNQFGNLDYLKKIKDINPACTINPNPIVTILSISF